MHVPSGERPDRSGKDERQDRERKGEPIKDEFDRKVIIVRDNNPVAKVDREMARSQAQHRGEDDNGRHQRQGDRRVDELRRRLLAELPVEQRRESEDDGQNQRSADDDQSE